jgi:NAD+ kinase
MSEATFIDVESTSSTPMPQSVGVLYHPRLPESYQLAEEIVGVLHHDWGVSAWLDSSWGERRRGEEWASLDLVVVLGGDGSLLRAARRAMPYQLPILGVNMGRVGFLAECQPSQWRAVFAQVMAGQYWIERRTMLGAEAWRGKQRLGQYQALNDIVVSRGSLARVVRLRTDIGGSYLATYVADGLIASTATGSTAYALAVGGPILSPQLKNMLILPIASHLSLDRAIVLDHDAVVNVGVFTDHQVALTVDGQFEMTLEDGDQVTIRAVADVARFARVQAPDYFYRTLVARLRRHEDIE